MIRLEIETGNDAFKPSEPEGWRQEAAWILHNLADRILTGKKLPLVLTDFNGNRVGLLDLDPDKPISAPSGARTE